MANPFSELNSTASTIAGNLLDKILSASGGSEVDRWIALKNNQALGQRSADRWLEAKPSAPVVYVEEAVALGQDNADDVVDAWRFDPDTWPKIMHRDASIFGAAYRFSETMLGSHLWASVTVNLSPTPSRNAEFFASHAGDWLFHHILSAIGPVQANALKSDGEYGGCWAGEWSANTDYGIGVTVLGAGSIIATSIGLSGKSAATEPKWTIPGAVFADHDITWRILTIIPDAIAEKIHRFYLSTAMVTVNLISQWSFHSPVTIDLISQWSFHSPVTIDLISQWSFHSPVTIDLTVTWDVEA